MRRASNVQDAGVLHVTRPYPAAMPGWPPVDRRGVVIAHKVTVHGCTIAPRAGPVSARSCSDGAVVEDEVMIGAGSVVTPASATVRAALPRHRPARARTDRRGARTNLVMGGFYVDLRTKFQPPQPPAA